MNGKNIDMEIREDSGWILEKQRERELEVREKEREKERWSIFQNRERGVTCEKRGKRREKRGERRDERGNIVSISKYG